MASVRKILVFSPPFKGHLNVIEKIIGQHPDLTIKLVITGWKNIPVDIDTERYDVELLAKSELHETDPAVWTLPRTYELLDDCVKIAELFDPDIILYDFFSLEGYLVGKQLAIPIWSSIPALIGPFIQRDYVEQKLKAHENVTALEQLRETHGIDLSVDDFELVSDGLHLPGDLNILWSYKSVVSEDFMTNRHSMPYVFLGNPHAAVTPIPQTQTGLTPTVLISFGTVVMGNLWDNQPNVRAGLRSMIEALFRIWHDAPHKTILVTQGKKILDEYPRSWTVVDEINQPELLHTVDVFVTHAGSNSFHESLLAHTPMIAIPFFGDQPLVAETIERLHAGINLIPSAKVDTHEQRTYLNAELATQLDTAVKKIFSDSSYREAIKTLDRSHAHFSDLLDRKIIFQEGDLLFGTNVARKKYIDANHLQGEFTILEFKAFSELAPKKTALPRIIDIYHDAILNEDYFKKDMEAGMADYAKHLKEYKSYLGGETDFERMCIKGIDFFTRYYTIHFLLEDYDPRINRITYAEIEHILANQSRLAKCVTFYKMNQNAWKPVSLDQVSHLQKRRPLSKEE